MGKVGLSVVGAYELGARLSTSSCLRRLEESACWAMVKTGRPPWRRRSTIEHAYGWKIIVFLVDLNFMSMCYDCGWSGVDFVASLENMCFEKQSMVLKEMGLIHMYRPIAERHFM